MSQQHSLRDLVTALSYDIIPGQLQTQAGTLTFGELARAAQTRALSLKPACKHCPEQSPGRQLLVAAPTADFLIELLACWWAGVLPLVVDDWLAARLDPDWLMPPDNLAQAMPADAALVLFTSGSAGEPKGVVLSHQGILSQLEAVTAGMQLSEPAAVAVLLPLHHAFALITQVLLTLSTGGELHLLPAGLLPGERLAYLEQSQIQRLAGVPTHFRALLEGDVKLPALKHLQVAGAALELPLAERILKACPNAVLWVGYGLTEAGPRVSAVPHTDQHFWAGTAGRPLPGVELREREGIIEIQSPALMLGYLDKPETTARVFDAEGWLSSGDTGHIEADYLYLSGRSDDLFMVAGEKVAPLEIEKSLLGCPGVQAAAVYGEPDELLGHQIIALIQGDVEIGALRRWVRSRLPSQKRPHSWYAVTQLPLTASGKLKRRELKQWPKQRFTPVS